MKWLKLALLIALILWLSCTALLYSFLVVVGAAVVCGIAADLHLFYCFPLAGDSVDTSPPPSPPPPINGCDSDLLRITLQDLRISRVPPGFPEETTYVWVALLEQDSVVSCSKCYAVIQDTVPHQFLQRSFSLSVDRSSLTPGIHQVIVYASHTAEDVGLPHKRVWNSRAYLIDITTDYLSTESETWKIEVSLGDSLRLYAHPDPDDQYNVFIDTIPGNELEVAWGMNGDNGQLIMEGNHAIFIATQLTTANRRTFVDARVSADTCGRVELVVTPMTYNLEYDHQESYDVLDYSNTATVNYLFDGTDIVFNVVASDTNLADCFVKATELDDYYDAHRNTSYAGYLCGMRGFADQNGNFADTIYGFTNVTYHYSFVRGYNHEYIGITDAHELGHQIAGLPELCNDWGGMNPFHSDNSCLMGDMPIARCTGEDITSNPHFCDSCINVLKNASW